jgi:hypothetical protein
VRALIQDEADHDGKDDRDHRTHSPEPSEPLFALGWTGRPTTHGRLEILVILSVRVRVTTEM